MYSAQDVSPIGGADVVYFASMVLLGNFLALNLVVAVLKTELSRATAIQRLKMMEAHLRKITGKKKRAKKGAQSPQDGDDDSYVSQKRRGPGKERAQSPMVGMSPSPSFLNRKLGRHAIELPITTAPERHASPTRDIIRRGMEHTASVGADDVENILDDVSQADSAGPDDGDSEITDSRTGSPAMVRAGSDSTLRNGGVLPQRRGPSTGAEADDSDSSRDEDSSQFADSQVPSMPHSFQGSPHPSSGPSAAGSRADSQNASPSGKRPPPPGSSPPPSPPSPPPEGTTAGGADEADTQKDAEIARLKAELVAAQKDAEIERLKAEVAGQKAQVANRDAQLATLRASQRDLYASCPPNGDAQSRSRSRSPPAAMLRSPSAPRDSPNHRASFNAAHDRHRAAKAAKAASRMDAYWNAQLHATGSHHVAGGSHGASPPHLRATGAVGILRTGGDQKPRAVEPPTVEARAGDDSSSGASPVNFRHVRRVKDADRHLSVVPSDPSAPAARKRRPSKHARFTPLPRRPSGNQGLVDMLRSPGRVAPPSPSSSASGLSGIEPHAPGLSRYSPRFWARKLVLHPWFEHLLLILVLLNTLCMAIEYDGMSDEFLKVLDDLNTVFTYIFVGELVLKLWALGPREYAKDRFNLFDAVITTLGFVQLMIESSMDLSALRSLKAGRVMRLMRLTRMARLGRMVKHFQRLQELVKVIGHSLASLVYIGLLLILFMFIFAILGMQLFGGKFDFDDPSSANSFDSFLDALITVFLILTIEEWNLVMYDGMRALGPAACLYFLAWVIGGVYVLLSLFMAVILDSFEDNADLNPRKRKKRSRRALQKLTGQLKLGGKGQESGPTRDPDVGNLSPAASSMSFVSSHSAGGSSNASTPHCIRPPANGLSALDGSPSPNGSPARLRISLKDAVGKVVVQNRVAGAFIEQPEVAKKQAYGYSLGCLSPTNPLRLKVLKLIHHRYFERTVLVAILLNSIAMAAEPADLRKGTTHYMVLFTLDIGFTVVFALEMTLKILAHGLIANKNAYLQSTWNCFDALVVLSSIVDLAIASSTSYDIGFVKVFRLLRALRPLRMVARLPGMRVVVGSLTRAIPGVMTHVFITVMIMLVFSIVFPQLFMGKLKECSDPDIIRRDNCVGQYFDPARGAYVEREWVKAFFNFDNTPWAFVTLFVVATREGWPSVLWSTIDSPDWPEKPEKGWFFLFFLYIVAVSFFLINMFTGILYRQFANIRAEMNMGMFLTREQRNWVTVQKTVLRARLAAMPFEPSTQPRACVFRLVRSNAFEGVVMGMIVCNIGLMAASHDDEPPLFTAVATATNIAFSSLFLVEALLKMYGLGKRAYYADGWNRFDFVITLGGLVDIGFTVSQIITDGSLMPPPEASADIMLIQSEDTTDDAISTATQVGRATRIARIARLVRVFRVSRMFRLIRFMQGVMELLKAVILSLPALLNVGSLLFLFLFIYAVAGVSLFGLIVYNGILTEHANFSTWPLSMLTLVRLATGEDWQMFMRACMVGTGMPGTMQDPCEGKHCGTVAAVPFFISFVTLLTFVMLSLFVAVILENFAKSTKASDAELLKADIKKEHVNAFLKAWHHVLKEEGAKSSDYLPWEHLTKLLQELQPPLGVGRAESDRDSRYAARKIVAGLKVRSHGGLVHYREVMMALSERLVGVEIPEEHDTRRDLDRLSKNNLPGKGKGQGAASDERDMMLFELVAVINLQRAWRDKMGLQLQAGKGGRRRRSSRESVSNVLSKFLADKGGDAEGRPRQSAWNPSRRKSVGAAGMAAWAVQRPRPRSKSLVEACSKSLSSPLNGRSPRPTPPLPGAPAQSDRVRSSRDGNAPASEDDLKAALERRAQTAAEADALRKLKSARRRQSRSRDLEGKVVIQDLEQAPAESSAAASKRITDEVKP